MNKPTDKQLDFIDNIEKVLDISFTGETRKEASDFIAENIEEFKHIKADLKEEYNFWNDEG